MKTIWLCCLGFFLCWFTSQAMADSTPHPIIVSSAFEVLCHGERVLVIDADGRTLDRPTQLRYPQMPLGFWIECHHGEPRCFFDPQHQDQ